MDTSHAGSANEQLSGKGTKKPFSPHSPVPNRPDRPTDVSGGPYFSSLLRNAANVNGLIRYIATPWSTAERTTDRSRSELIAMVSGAGRTPSRADATSMPLASGSPMSSSTSSTGVPAVVAAIAARTAAGNIISPGTGLNVAADPAAGAKLAEKAHGAGGTVAFIEHIMPTSLLSSLTEGNVLQTPFVALLVGFGLQAMGATGEPILHGVGLVQKLVFRVLAGILWLAPIGAFGAIAKVVGETGFDAVIQLGVLMGAFYVTCVVFVFGVLGVIMWLVAGMSIFAPARLCLIGCATNEFSRWTVPVRQPIR